MRVLELFLFCLPVCECGRGEREPTRYGVCEIV